MKTPRFCLLIILISICAGCAEASANTDKQEAAYPQPDTLAPSIGTELPYYEQILNDAPKGRKAAVERAIAELRSEDPDFDAGIFKWKRPLLIASGVIPEDTPRLTLEDAISVMQNGGDPVTEFNRLAGAPDFEGGSGLHRSVYYINDEKTEGIVVMGGVIYFTTDENGKRSEFFVTSRGIEQMSAEPSPSP
jgi:hypothetical protein